MWLRITSYNKEYAMILNEGSQFGDLLVTMATVVPKISFVTMEPFRNDNAGVFAMTTVVKNLTVYAYHTMPC